MRESPRFAHHFGQLATADGRHPRRRELLRVREVRRQRDQPPAEHLVPSHEAGAQERLELPRLRPALPVLQVGGHRTGQVTRLAVSEDGIHFGSRPEVLGVSYFRVFRRGGFVYGLGMPGIFYRSRDGETEFEEGPTLTRIEAQPSSQSSSARTSAESSATPAVTAETSKGPEEKSAPPAADEAKSSAVPSEETKSPAAALPKPESKTASKAASSRPPAAPVGTTPSAPAAAPQIAAHPVAPAGVTAATASPAIDRWAQFSEELHRCQSEAARESAAPA